MKSPSPRHLGKTAVVSLALLAIWFAACAPAVSAAPRDKVAVVRFQGPRSAQLEARVTRLLAEERGWNLISAKAYASAAKRIDATRQNAKDVAAVAEALDADAVVSGKVVGKSRRARLVVSVRDGGTGEVVEQIKLKLRKGKLSAQGQRLLQRKLVAALDAASPDEPINEPKRASEPAQDEPAAEPIVVQTDSNGQAIDDETPDVLK